MTLLRIIREVDRAVKRAERDRIKRWKAEEREKVRLQKEAERQRKAEEREKQRLRRQELVAKRSHERHLKQMTKFKLEGLKLKESAAFDERSSTRDKAKWKILREVMK